MPPICIRAGLAAAGVNHKKNDQQGVKNFHCAFNMLPVDVPKLKKTKNADILRADKMIEKESCNSVIDC